MSTDPSQGLVRGFRASSSHQRVLRLCVLASPLIALSAAFAAASDASPWLIIFVLGLSLSCAALPESHVGLLTIVVLAWHWAGTVHDVTTPWLLVAGVALAVFHTSMAAATVAPFTARWTPTMRSRWAGRLAIVMAITAASWVLARTLTREQIDGSAVVFAAALVAIAATAAVLRWRGLARSF